MDDARTRLLFPIRCPDQPNRSRSVPFGSENGPSIKNFPHDMREFLSRGAPEPKTLDPPKIESFSPHEIAGRADASAHAISVDNIEWNNLCKVCSSESSLMLYPSYGEIKTCRIRMASSEPRQRKCLDNEIPASADSPESLPRTGTSPKSLFRKKDQFPCIVGKRILCG